MDSFYFNIGLIQKFWDERDKELVPSVKNQGMGIKKQKLLFFYNIFSKFKNEQYTFENLKAFKDGPIYYDIWIKTSKENCFLEQIELKKKYSYNEDIFNATRFLLESERSEVISEITHQLDLWKKNYTPEKLSSHNSMVAEAPGIYHNSEYISEHDITTRDIDIINFLLEYLMYVDKHYKLKKINNNIFAIKKEFYNEIIMEYQDMLSKLKKSNSPIKVKLKDNGGELIYGY